MNWLLWQLHRKQFGFALLALAVFAAVAIPVGIHITDVYHHALTTCSQTATCDNLGSILFQGDGALFDGMALVPVAIPFLLGLFWGAPLIAKEYEEGTNKLAWTQGVTRRRWLTANIVWMLVSAAIFGAATSLIATWWGRTPNALHMSQFSPVEFDGANLMPVVYSVFAVALGALFGAWFKKVMLALAVTLGVLAVIQIGMALGLRPLYQAPAIQRTSIENSRDPSGQVWILHDDIVNSHDQPVNLAEPTPECGGVDRQDDRKTGTLVTCLAAHGYQWKTVYQPADRYWKFQVIEAGIYVAATVVAVGGTYALVLKRDA